MLYINKLEAARRQLDAAIRMTFDTEDELAIHTVAAAAYRILRDILEKRGRHDKEELVRAGVYDAARSLAHGQMSDDEIEDLKQLQLFRLVSFVAEDIKVRGDQVTPSDVPVGLSKTEKLSDWQSMSAAANFLKHADRQPDATLPLDEVDNDALVIRACAAYAMLSRRPTAEMRVFYIDWSLRAGHKADLEGLHLHIADTLEPLSPSRRRRACARLIRISEKDGLL
jgi:hypothetical protein